MPSQKDIDGDSLALSRYYANDGIHINPSVCIHSSCRIESAE